MSKVPFATHVLRFYDMTLVHTVKESKYSIQCLKRKGLQSEEILAEMLLKVNKDRKKYTRKQ